MRYLAALLFFYSIEAAVPEVMPDTWYPEEFGMPCSTKIDVIENTCFLDIKRPKNGNNGKQIKISQKKFRG